MGSNLANFSTLVIMPMFQGGGRMRKGKLGITIISILIIFLSYCSLTVLSQTSQGSSADIVEEVLMEYRSEQSGFAIGLDSTFLLGSMTKNGFDYPKNSFGISPFLGIDYRNYSGQPDVYEVETVANDIVKNNPSISKYNLKRRLKSRLDPSTLNYFQFGTEAFIIPKIGAGVIIPFDDEYNAMFDIGICFPWILSIGFMASF